MMLLLDLLLLAPALILFALALFYAAEVFAAFLPPRRIARGAVPGNIAVVVPAHDEEASIGATLASLKGQLRTGDRLVVIADNCADRTAEIAAAGGAEALIRRDSDRRGKGYALQFAIDALQAAPPDIVVFIDADCFLAPGALAEARAAAGAGRPAQMLYLMRAAAGAGPSQQVAEFAWLLMNGVRMRGLMRLFDVTRLTGAGMALPWSVAKDLDLASGEIVEDLALSARLAESATPPILCPTAVVESFFPQTAAAAAKQRARWEHGSMRLAARRAPVMLARAAATGNLRLLGAALDLAIPPLVVFSALTLLFAVLSLAPLAWGNVLPLSLALSAVLVVFFATATAWIGFGRQALPPSALIGAIGYVGGKARVYGAEGRASSRRWTRTDRDAAP